MKYYGGNLIAESVSEGNAAFIVKVANAHDALVAALKSARGDLDMKGIDTSEADAALRLAGIDPE